MTAHTTDTTLQAAAVTLRAVAAANSAVFVFVGEAVPSGATRLIQLDLIDDIDDPDYEAEGEVTRLQVNTVAPKLSDAVRLAGAVKAKLTEQGFTRRGGRRLPKAAGETLNGMTADYVR